MPARYWVGGTGVWDNVAGTKWSATSGGPGGASAPTSADDVFFDANSGSGTVTTAATAICLRADFTGFAGTFNVATNWTCGADLTFSAGMTITGTGGLIKNNSGGIYRFNGQIYPGSWFYPGGNGFSTSIADNLTFGGNIVGGTNSNLVASSSPVTITVLGNLGWVSGVNLNNVSFIMGGTGTLSGTFVRTAGMPGITINTPGTISHNANLVLSSISFTYVAGTFNSTAPIIFTGTFGSSVNNVSSITFASMAFGSNNGQTVSLNSDMNVAGGLTNSTTFSVINGPGRLFIGGTITPTVQISGTATIEMNGSTNASISAGTILNSLVINKATPSTTVTLTGNLTWGANNNQLTLLSGIFQPQNFTVTLNPAIVTTVSNMRFWNLTVGANHTLIQSVLNLIDNNLTLLGNTTFQGTRGFTAANFICTVAGAVITLHNINIGPLVQYLITSSLNLIGTAASRIILQASGFSTFTGIANGTNLLFSSGMAPSVGMTVSQNSGIAPAGFLSLFPTRPTVTGGTNPNFTLSHPVTPSTGSISMRAGYKAIFTLQNGATQNVGYVTTHDIDSSGGQTIQAFASAQDDTSINTNLYRTLNWGNLTPPPVKVLGNISIR